MCDAPVALHLTASRSTLALFLLVALLCSSCAAFSHGAMGEIETAPVLNAGRPTISLKVEITGETPVVRGDCIASFEDSGLFARSLGPDWTISIDARMQVKNRGSLGALLPALTFFIVPGKLTSARTEIDATIFIPASGRSEKIQLNGRTDIWMGIPMLPFAFSGDPFLAGYRRSCTQLAFEVYRLYESLSKGE